MTAAPILLALALQAAQDPAEVAAGLELPELALADLDRWAARVRPTAGESAFGEIDWIPEFGEGLARASDEEKPLLFWAMNGHPLGCT